MTSARSLGCTFLDWSLHWLSGADQIFSVKEKEWVDIVQNPLQSDQCSNAHKHKKNHYSGWHANKVVVESLLNQPGFKGRSFYPFPLHLDQCCDKLGYSIDDLENQDIMKSIMEYQKQDYVDLLQWVAEEKNIPLIFVGFDRSVQGYKWQLRSLRSFVTSDKEHTNDDGFWEEYQNIYFSSSMKKWESLHLTEIWDVRERMALDLRPFDIDPYDNLSLTCPHHWINCQDLWFDTERSIKSIMDFLDLKLVDDRYRSWLPVAKQWQTMQNDVLKFYRSLQHIIDSIVQGGHCDLPDLTLNQESIIQHCLIYQHGLNIKTWQLKKFPSNTKELHNLLEPSIHTV